MIINRIHSTGTCRLLANFALVGAAIAIPTTASAIPAMAAPTAAPGVVQTNFPQCGSDDPWCNRDSQWTLNNGKESDSEDEECEPPAWNQGWKSGGKEGEKQGGNHGWNNMSPNGWFSK
ncbi:hypothetical protein [Nocardia sp. NPDC057440]|uniref:hypothetical protein n=1 Tax=Nocardia sp. NPDC057440 TaxID=3346134 RepID=UPI0036704B14